MERADTRKAGVELVSRVRDAFRRPRKTEADSSTHHPRTEIRSGPLSLRMTLAFLLWLVDSDLAALGDLKLCPSSPEGEDDVDGGLDFDGFSAKQIRFVAPGLDGVDCGLLQQGRTADEAEILDSAGFGDGGLQHHGTFGTNFDGDPRVDGKRFVDQQTFDHGSGETDRGFRNRVCNGNHGVAGAGSADAAGDAGCGAQIADVDGAGRLRA